MTLEELQEVAYGKVNLSFDRELFAKEYDEFILPNSVPITNGLRSWDLTRPINNAWGMVNPETYDKCNVQEYFGGEIINRGIEQWSATSLIQLVTDDETMLRVSGMGSVTIRNNLLGEGNYVFKDMYKDLAITKWIQQLPISKLIGVRCVSLKPETFASIHRDENNVNHKQAGSSLGSNKLWRAGFISITLNISDGGQPIYFSIDSDMMNPTKVNDQVYLFNDYCLHGVPVVSSRRRQIRVTGTPTEEFLSLVDKESLLYLGKI